MKYKFKIIGDRKLIHELESQITNNSSIICDTDEVPKDMTNLGFGFDEVSAIIVVVEGVKLIAELSLLIYKAWDSNKKEILIQTPFRTIKFETKTDLSEEKVAEILKELAQIK